MIHFAISAKNIEEARQKIRESGIMGDEPTLIMPTIEPQPWAEPEPEQEQPQPKAEPYEQPEQEQPEQEQPVKTYDLVAVRAAANAYKDKHGIEKLREIFKKHGGEKLKDIPEANYAALMEDIA